jgi:hypothetical protein
MQSSALERVAKLTRGRIFNLSRPSFTINRSQILINRTKRCDKEDVQKRPKANNVHGLANKGIDIEITTYLEARGQIGVKSKNRRPLSTCPSDFDSPNIHQGPCVTLNKSAIDAKKSAFLKPLQSLFMNPQVSSTSVAPPLA